MTISLTVDLVWVGSRNFSFCRQFKMFFRLPFQLSFVSAFEDKLFIQLCQSCQTFNATNLVLFHMEISPVTIPPVRSNCKPSLRDKINYAIRIGNLHQLALGSVYKCVCAGSVPSHSDYK